MPSSLFRSLGLLVLLACKGGDATPTGEGGDQDGDGYSPPADCDDSDPNINPEAVDVWNDGVDADCDDEDRGTDDFTEFALSIRWAEGATAEAEQSRACDLNGDGVLDLLLVENREEAARLLAFEGPFTAGPRVQSEASWVLQIDDAVQHVFCSDFDGDGTDDVIVAEVPDLFGQLDTQLHLFLQPGGGFDAPEQADAVTLTHDIDYVFWPADLNADGLQDYALVGGLQDRMLLAGTTPAAGTLADATSDLPGPEFDRIQSLDDLDGDGTPELLYCDDDTCDVYGPIQGGAPTLLAHVGIPASADNPGPAVVGDFDGDGARDDLATTSLALGIAISIDAGADLASGTTITIPSYSATFRGTNHVLDAGDFDGDGVDDLLHWVDGTDGEDRRLYSGAALVERARKPAATLLQVQRNNTQRGNHFRGDFDGDGADDIVFVGSGGGEGFLGAWLTSVY